MSRLTNFISNTASAIGNAVGSYQKARASASGSKPQFIRGLTAESGGWQGGNIANSDSAQMRAARNGWFFLGVNTKALDLSASKVDIWHNPSGIEDDGVKADGHPFLKVLRRPNPYMGKALMFQYIQWWLDLQGESFIFMEPDAFGTGIKSLYPLPANKMDIEFSDDGLSIKRYIARLQMWYYIDPKYIIHIRYPNPWDFFRGMSPLISYMLTIDSDLAMKMWNGTFFGKDNVMPSAVISLGTGNPNELFDPADVEAVKAELQSEYSAIRRKTAITNANSMAVALLGYNAKEMDFLGGMGWNKDEILEIIGVPASMVDKTATEANAKVGKTRFKDNMWGVKSIIDDQITVDCLQPFYNEALELRHEDDRVYDRELELREAGLAKEALPRDEWARRYFDYELKPGEVTMSEQRQQVAMETAKQRFGDKQFGDKADKGASDKAGTSTPSKPDKNVNPNMSTKSIDGELQAFRTKAVNWFKLGKLARITFKSATIDTKTVASIVKDLQGVEQRTDIDHIFDYWQGTLEGGNEHDIPFEKAWSFRLWSALEEVLINVIHTALQGTLRLLIDNASEDMLGNTSLWGVLKQRFGKDVQPVFQQIAEKAASDTQAMLQRSGIRVDYNLTNQRAIEWALNYSAEQITGIGDTDKKAVQLAIGDWIEGGRDNGINGLVTRLENLTDQNGVPLFSRERAERIARSEATSVYAGAAEAVMVASGYPSAVFKPRAHVNCRCYIQPGRHKGQRVIVWYTARDERVCTVEIETPFGTVEGCRELHRTIVSENFAGEKYTKGMWEPQQ